MSIKLIQSRDNPLYKQIRQLATSAQARKKAGQTLLDGVHLCQAWLSQHVPPSYCIVSDTATVHHEVLAILNVCLERQVNCIQLPDALFSALSQVENGVEVLFVVDVPIPTHVESLNENAILLDQLQDPGNVGSILRSAAAAGIKKIFCSSSTVAAWSPKVLRAGMGAHFVVDIYESSDLPALVRNARIPVIATSSHAKQTIYGYDLSKKFAWLFGHEGQGVSAELLACASVELAIPHDPSMESLNVAASAAVCLFEQLRQINFTK
jgi:TrmH family RNA methyltransferase